jgi:hypothetical protein
MTNNSVLPALLVSACIASVFGYTYLSAFTKKSAKGFLVSDRLSSVPPRSPASRSGSSFINSIRNLNSSTREFLVLREIEKGNVPKFLRHFVPININGSDKNGRSQRLTIWVMRDYLSVGSDKDYVRIPLTPIAARKIAEDNNLMLPTSKLVDEIYRSASIHLDPISMTPGPRMASVDYIVRHNRLITKDLIEKRQLEAKSDFYLLAGHKKDVVETEQLNTRPDRVAIYGWHQNPKRVIQPLSLVHGINYVDYSHGIRFVARDALLNGRTVDLLKLMEHPSLSSLVTYE